MTIEESFRALSTKERALTPHHHIDPGFINKRLCFSTFNPWLSEQYAKYRLPEDDFSSIVSNDHLLVSLVLGACRSAAVPTLGTFLQDPKPGVLICSTERIEPNAAVDGNEHTRSQILPSFDCEQKVHLEFHPRHIVADTPRMNLREGATLSMVAGVESVAESEIVARPLVIGAPTYQHQFNRDIPVDLLWYGWKWYEVLPTDIAEFSEARAAPVPDQDEWSAIMRDLSERDVNEAFCELLSDLSKPDWAGEQDDHFASALHLGEEEATAAFIFKGPGGGFREMTPDLLGKRADQIYRMACTPADILIVQHCHHISEAVRATLRAFAVAPHNPRRFCLIDGKETYRILKVYGKLPKESCAS